MQVVEGATHAPCLRKYCNQTLPVTFHQDPETCTQLSTNSHGTRRCESPLVIVKQRSRKTLSRLKLQVVSSINLN